MAIVLTKDNFEQEVLACEVPVIIDFFATWCQPCKMQAPILEELEKSLGGQVKVCKVDVDEQIELAMRYGIASIPTLVFMYKGMLQNRVIGLTGAEDIKINLQNILANGGNLKA